MVRLALRLATMVGGAVLLALAFPPLGWWFLAPVAVACLALGVAGTRLWQAALYGYAAGLVFFGILLWWIRVVGPEAWVALTLFSALYLALTAWGTAAVMRRPGWPVSIALVWVLQEAVRDRVPLGGWPWGRLAYSQSDAPWLPAASLGGAVMLTVLAALAGGLLAWIGVHLYRHDLRVRPLAIGVVAVLVVLLAPLVIRLPVNGQTDGGPASAQVAIIQGDVPRIGLGFVNAERRAVLDNHVRETMRLADAVQAGAEPQPVAVIWPENASDLDPYTAPDAVAAINAAAAAIRAPILVGALRVNPDDPTTVLNVGIVWDPRTGPGATYVKQHPVPFGEYIPFRGLLADRIDKLRLIPHDYAPGDHPGVLQVGPVRLGDVICFEVAYDEIVRDTVNAGARTLAVQTNNATYTGTTQTAQQFAMARIRAVEHERTVAVAATNGISGLYLPDGTLVAELGERTAGWINRPVPLRDSFSIADRLGVWPEVLLACAGLIITIWGILAVPSVWPRVVPGTRKVNEPARMGA